jgi:hypothetical protein
MRKAQNKKFTAKEEVPPNDSPANGMPWVKTLERAPQFEVNLTETSILEKSVKTEQWL